MPAKKKKIKSKKVKPFYESLHPADTKQVQLYHEKRNAFHKVGFNENHIPNQKNYEKKRKTRLEQWDNPPHSWPHFLPRPTMHHGKTLIQELEREYLNEIK